MTADISIWSYISNADFVVKCVMSLLFLASIASWAIIFERILFYKKQWRDTRSFEKSFWSGASLQTLLQESESVANKNNAMAAIFNSGLTEFSHLQSNGSRQRQEIIDGAQRAMQIAQAKETDQMTWPLSLLATIGSVSPYVGLFGTVWGIMHAFQALGTVQQASIAMVAPGISEALIATAIGLFAAIPAVIAYNRFNNQVSRLQHQYDTFEAEFTNILYREI